MEIILTKDVENLGLAGQVLNVAPGYARNFLLPTGVALMANKGNLTALAKKRAEFESRAKTLKENALAQRDRIAEVLLVLARKSGEKGKLYGAVTAQDLVEAAAAKGLELDRKKLRLSEPIKAIGDYEVTIRLHPEVLGAIRVRVVREGDEVAPPLVEAPPEEGPVPAKSAKEDSAAKSGAA
ncbi:MAG: 50S ribosomal protein L9 [Deltaproteobacteria bacterium]|jgi:large subunit ribosomal protein L9|nr:50S ribosomal protein L9 [Deltaproteobacteria bacterium]